MGALDSQTIIAVCALMTILFGIIQVSVWPIRKSIDKLEAGQAELGGRLDRLEAKLDQLLAKS